MSHVVNLKVMVKNPSVLLDVARQHGFKVEEGKTVRFYSGERTGLSVQLPGWRYPVVVDDEGAVHYDNYNGRWGNIQELHRLMQDYAVEVVKQEALLQGATVFESTQEDGTVVLRVGVGGAW